MHLTTLYNMEIFKHKCFDGDKSSNYLSGANGLAKLARNAALFARRVASESMFSSESRAKRTLFERIIDGGRLGEELAQRGEHSLDELAH